MIWLVLFIIVLHGQYMHIKALNRCRQEQEWNHRYNAIKESIK